MSSKQIGKRRNDGDNTGLKQDRYRNSRFEYERWRDQSPQEGMTHKTVNTLGGAYEENRGRRTADERFSRDDNPFENGDLHNWNHRKGWDRYYDASYNKEANKRHGGAIMDHDAAHRGKGPKGYTRSDERVFEDVCEALSLSPNVDASEIEVKVKEGIVYLNGSVDKRESKRFAEFAIENISGVHDVQNQLNIQKSDENKGTRDKHH
jgi:osmotically-inducible protein OsmY